ncbi:hypothetical protein DEU56DRAFT_752400 [Suillus clintonianus]|uniref:uncharacterized protein n=1 Tax=Suillus clintonianus TaxID=1904413 RepID=UPI001B86BFC1|nr:uncharacterized protein DEU56DRAFT_752400 [Suillus clintonianus]KAG2151507.1 hypothetical protein DEU56DRAFT_752400 [Suillus clintonianus]
MKTSYSRNTVEDKRRNEILDGLNGDHIVIPFMEHRTSFKGYMNCSIAQLMIMPPFTLTSQTTTEFKNGTNTSDEEPNTQLWMGSAMLIDEPKSPGILGSAQDVSITSPNVGGDEEFQAPISMANIANNISSSQVAGPLSSKKKKLARGLQKAINRCLRRHCKGGHPTTDLLRERIHAALEGALLGMEVDDIISNGEDKPKTNDKRGTVQRARPEPLLVCGRGHTLAGMPGGYPIATETEHT